MYRFWVMSLIITIGVVVETTVHHHLAFFGVLPNLMLILTVSYGILRGDEEGAAYGLGGGLLRDIAFGQAIGLFAALGMLSGYFAGKSLLNFYRESFLLPMLITGTISLAYGFVLYLFNIITIAPVGPIYYTLGVIVPETIYTMLVSIPIYRILFLLNQNIENHERKHRKLFK